DHYLPAFKASIKEARAEVDAIVNDSGTPDFANTIEALEAVGGKLDRVENVFYGLNDLLADDQMQAIARDAAPLRTEFYDDISLNAELFQRVKAVYQQKDQLDLNTEQQTLLQRTWEDFVRGGANLDGEQKARFREINKELALLSLKFGDNILAENNRYELVIDNQADLVGLPDNVIATAAETAASRGHEGKWVFTIHKPSMLPFLTYSQKRDLRQQIFTAYITKGNHGDELDNNEIVRKTVSLRVERANLLGFPTHADFVVDVNMSKTPQNVYDLLDQLWTPAQNRAKTEVADMQDIIDADGGGFKLEPWDWWYYAEKVKQSKYDLDDELLRQYFKLENVQQACFDVANKLWGITFTRRNDVPLYHPDVIVYEVKEADGSHIGLLMTDYHPRASKSNGAWMGGFRKQSRSTGKALTPVIYNVFNFTTPTADMPSLISLDEVETLFHEFGHALQGLLSDCYYNRLSGTSVARDYVELCSQIMENWGEQPEMLKSYARHYQTDEPMPDELIRKIQNTHLFNQGFETVEYLAVCYLDMDWHTLTDTEMRDVKPFEDASMARIGLIPEIVPRYHTSYLKHAFVWGYSSGYYNYIWAEVLDQDAFQAFKETSLFDQATAAAFREHILSTGGTEDPMVLYKRFRGREPRIEPLLVNRGLN
ncbi:M3 family metallopeptidase, partial [Candidatus Neomarinimicrobiota bacterium]